MTSPFKFLDSFIREDREIFFEGEKEIDELYRKIFESKILLGVCHLQHAVILSFFLGISLWSSIGGF
jgi:hypothetical protein